MSQSSVFWDKIAEKYSNTPLADPDAYEKKLEVMRQYLGPDVEVLEFGCGTGSTAIRQAPFAKHILAIDFSENMIEIANRKRENGDIDNITFRQTSIDELAVPDQSFDVVLGLSILHLLKNEREVISKVHGLLKPGGVFVSSTACIGDTMAYMKYVLPIARLFGFAPYVNIFTTRTLTENLTNAGFSIDYQWQPGKGKAVFIVAKKSG